MFRVYPEIQMIDKTRLPRHIAIIMDGNGRWAQDRGLPKTAGHKAGVESVRHIVTYCRRIGVPYLTVYAFSTENWTRPKHEVSTLMGLVKKYLALELKSFKKNDIRLNCIGRLDGLPASVEKEIRSAMEKTESCGSMTFTVALNYGSRGEIVDAVNRIVREGHRFVDEKAFRGFLYTKDMPDPDLVIRTSGEMRISNFLLWQASYSELYFTEKLWPDFRASDLDEAIEEYQKRDRRFGGRS